MVAGIKGVQFLSETEVAVTSSTFGEVLVVSLAAPPKVLRTVKLKAKVEALSVVKGGTALLVADGSGSVSRVDLGTEPASVECVATLEGMRLTSVAAFSDDVTLVGGAGKDDKLNGKVWVLEKKGGPRLLHECPMVRALHAEEDRCLFGAIDVDDEDARDATTRVIETRPPFKECTVVATVNAFVHAMARRSEGVYVLLTRHGDATAFDCPIRVVKFSEDDDDQDDQGAESSLDSNKKKKKKRRHHTLVTVRTAIASTLPISKADGTINSSYSYHALAASIFGKRAGREHAMALHPNGTTLVTGAVDKSTKGVLQVWHLEFPGGAKDGAAADSASSSFCCGPSLCTGQMQATTPRATPKPPGQNNVSQNS